MPRGRKKGVPHLDLTGRRFNRWTAISVTNNYKARRFTWIFRCDCGSEKELNPTYVIQGESKSCGCLASKLARNLNKGTHKMSRTLTYSSYVAMKKRCLNTKHHAYPRYGGRGIGVCQRWKSFENFFADMGERPSKKHTIDRIDNDAGYHPDNCRWADWGEQQSNRRKKRFVEWNGRQYRAKEIAQIVGLPLATINTRLSKMWPIDLVVSKKKFGSKSPELANLNGRRDYAEVFPVYVSKE